MDFYHILLLICLMQFPKYNAQGECSHSCVSNGTCAPQQFGDICIYLFENENLVSWDENQQICRKQNLQMIKMTKNIMDDVEHPIFENRNYKDKGAWLGGKAKNLGGWKFLNNTDIRDLINETELAEKKHQYCGQIHIPISRNLTFGADGCSVRNFFLCRFDLEGKFQHLKIEEFWNTWFEARAVCIENGGDLFYIRKGENSTDMINKIRSALADVNINVEMSMHIGIVHQLWRWHGREQILYTNWQDGEPNESEGNCLMMLPNGKWNDGDCYTPKPAFCQDGTELSVDPMPTTRASAETTTEVRSTATSTNASTTTESSATTTGSSSTTAESSSTTAESLSATAGNSSTTTESSPTTVGGSPTRDLPPEAGDRDPIYHATPHLVLSTTGYSEAGSGNDSMSRNDSGSGDDSGSGNNSRSGNDSGSGNNSNSTSGTKTQISKVSIILGVLLGVFFLATLVLIGVILFRRRRKKSNPNEETDVALENPYAETSSNGINPASVGTANSPAHYAGRQQQNGSRAQGNEYSMDEHQTKPVSAVKPRIKPKPVIGPKTGDVYAVIDKKRSNHDSR